MTLVRVQPGIVLRFARAWLYERGYTPRTATLFDLGACVQPTPRHTPEADHTIITRLKHLLENPDRHDCWNISVYVARRTSITLAFISRIRSRIEWSFVFVFVS